jgi:RND family efflux transporter MFP subunit
MGDANGTGRAAEAEAGALGELARCETVAQKAAWGARWSARVSGADAALVFGIDVPTGGWIALGAFGEGAAQGLRRVIPRDAGVTREVVRERTPRVLRRSEKSSASDPLVSSLPESGGVVLVAPLLLDKGAAGVVALSFRQDPASDRLARLDAFLPDVAAALDRAQIAERKTSGHLFAIERLTNLYDASKAFGSTIDLEDLSILIARKTADFAAAEAASFWVFDAEAESVSLAATAVNENYEVEEPPESVGGPIVGDVLANREPLRKNVLEDHDPLRHADPAFETRSVLAVPLIEDDSPIGVLVAANKRGRHPEFSEADEDLLADVARQAVAALRNARQYEAEKKVQELHALLTVSQEITATLDLDKVMAAVVNASAALISFERCALAILQRGRLHLGAVSGLAEIDRSNDSVRRTEALLEWVFFGGSDVAVMRQEDGTILTDRPETEEKFRVFFDESGRRAFYGVVLKDEEGKLGVLGFECDEPVLFAGETRDLLQILVNQATVALRNAQLYQQVPLAGLWQPLLQKWRKVESIPARRALWWAGGVLAALLVLSIIPWRIRVAGPARIVPLRRVAVLSAVDGFISAVKHREGDVVAAGEVLATLRDERYRTELAEATSAKEIAESELNRLRAEGDAAAMYQALSKRDALETRIRLAESRMARTEIRAPVAGVVVTPRLDEKVGQFLPSTEELCVLADISAVTVEVAVAESEAAHLIVGEPLWAKMNPYPSRTFQGTVQHVAASLHEEGGERFVIAESRVENPDGLLKPGMLGKAKVSIGRHSLAAAIFRKPLRWVWLKLWPLLP